MNILRTGAPARRKLDELQSEIAGIDAEVRAAIHAKAPDEEVIEHCRRAVRIALDRAHLADVEGLLWSDSLVEALDFPRMKPLQNAVLPDLDFSKNPGLLVHLLGEDRAVQIFVDAALRMRKEAPGLAMPERRARIAQLKAERRKIERQEELEIQRLEAEGYTLLRRADADPEVLFAVWGENSFSEREETNDPKAALAVKEKHEAPDHAARQLGRRLNKGAVNF